MARLVASLEEVARNIDTYVESLPLFKGLADRIRQHTAWYAVKDGTGQWRFGPSKFIGYQAAEPEAYLKANNRRDGKETEPTLSQWFEPVNRDTALWRELRGAFEQFADAFGKVPNARWRVSVPREMVAAHGPAPADWRERIAFDPEIVHGRARIRGTRVRVIDILAALAAGDTPDQIVEALPYITHADIQAALQYAVTSLDHRVLLAA
jgi:uncharacterized protein (DUF433 family)